MPVTAAMPPTHSGTIQCLVFAGRLAGKFFLCSAGLEGVLSSGFRRILLLLLLVCLLASCRGQRIKVLLTGKVDVEENPLIKWFEQEPSVDANAVITRPSGLITTRDIQRFVRLYFPRNYWVCNLL